MRNFCILLAISLLCFSCAEKLSDENSISTQRKNIESFISSSSYDFEEMNGIYRARTSTTPDTAKVRVAKGDTVSVNYTIYTFTRSIGNFIYTNDETVAISQDAYTSAEDYEPLAFVYGTDNILKVISKSVEGTAVDNEYFVLATSDDGYGASAMGTVPKGSSLALTITITNIGKHE